MNITRRQLLLIFILSATLVVGDFCIEILAPDVSDWLKKQVGAQGYQYRLWALLFIAVIVGLLIGDWQNWFKKETTKSPSDELDLSLQVELIANLKAKYKKRIDSKLAGRFPVNLRITASKKGTSDETAQNFITLQDEEVGQEIGEIFDRAHGRLLVIGLPGAGKTTLLLQLAVELLGRAERVAHLEGVPHVTPTIPVLLNLATWRSEFATFDEWLKRILPYELGASKALAEKIRGNIPLILLLDGLDEVPKDDRNSCLEALGKYGIKSEFRFVLTSRIEEYTNAKDAPVYSQVEVAPLMAEQIEQSLVSYSGLSPEAKPLMNAIQKDSLLKLAFGNPFYLNTAQLLFASGKNWSEFGFKASSLNGRQREIVERFAEYCLTHKVKRTYSPGNAKKWLRFFAIELDKSGKINFELGDIQPGWSNTQSFIAFPLNALLGIIYGIFPLFLMGCFWLSISEFLFIGTDCINLFFSTLIGICFGILSDPYEAAKEILAHSIPSLKKIIYQTEFAFGIFVSGLILLGLSGRFIEMRTITLTEDGASIFSIAALIGLGMGVYLTILSHKNFLIIKSPYQKLSSPINNGS